MRACWPSRQSGPAVRERCRRRISRPRELRAWTLAAGRPEPDRYLLGLDPHAPTPIRRSLLALMRVGIAPTLGSAPEAAIRHCASAVADAYRGWWRMWGTTGGR